MVDGKQRLTTLTILLCAIRDRLGARVAWIDSLVWLDARPLPANAARRPRLQLDTEEEAFFDAEVRASEASLKLDVPDPEHRGQKGILDCQIAILEDLDDRSDDDLLALAQFLRDQISLVLITAPDIDRGFRVFLSTNVRGKPLSGTDILKAELMVEVPDADRAARLDAWRKLEKEMGTDFEDLPGYLRATYGKSSTATIREVLALSQDAGGAERFLDDVLFPLARRLRPILTASYAGTPHAPRINRTLRYLNWLRARDWVPPALTFLDRFPGHDAEFASFLEGLERLAYGLLIAGIGADRRVARYRQVIEALAAPDALSSFIEPLGLTEDEQGNMLINASGNLYHRSQAACRVLLKRLSATWPGDEPMSSLTDVSVEHLLPRNVSPDSGWRLAIPDPEEREACAKMLGNLVLVTKQQNKDARNDVFPVKKKVIFPDGQASPHAITNQVQDLDEWRAEDIRARNNVLFQRMIDIWQLKPKTPVKRSRRGRGA